MTPDIQALIEKITAQADWYSGFAANDYHEAVATMREAADALEQFQWRPIASAPQNGTDFFALVDGELSICYRSRFYKSWSIAWPNNVKRCEPTHWMPLPPPPKAG